LATTVQIVDFREATFYIPGGCFQIPFEKWPKEPMGEMRALWKQPSIFLVNVFKSLLKNV